nr:hypothetical protein CKG001_20210 [Bdellovibrio sp. CKG001]BFD67200.1 hypothetical protein HAGR004_22220 [Bdellovibrio sp. HAGR004]
MEVFRFNILPTEEFLKRESFRQAINNCEQCGTALEFSYKQMTEHAVLSEEASCPCCEQKQEARHHRIH